MSRLLRVSLKWIQLYLIQQRASDSDRHAGARSPACQLSRVRVSCFLTKYFNCEGYRSHMEFVAKETNYSNLFLMTLNWRTL